MVLARTSDAARDLSRQFRERLVEKRYLVLVEGTLSGIGTWTDYIAKPDRQPCLVDPDHSEGKRAVLEWQALASGDDRTLLQVELHTGRPHQIRLQATSRGHPVVGDQRYGATSSLGDRAIALHHAVLRVEHVHVAGVVGLGKQSGGLVNHQQVFVPVENCHGRSVGSIGEMTRL
ncbi:MAG: hypothetical protein BRD42_02225, partial [Bacteroidetes bacterium QS_3_64_15]